MILILIFTYQKQYSYYKETGPIVIFTQSQKRHIAVARRIGVLEYIRLYREYVVKTFAFFVINQNYYMIYLQNR